MHYTMNLNFESRKDCVLKVFHKIIYRNIRLSITPYILDDFSCSVKGGKIISGTGRRLLLLFHTITQQILRTTISNNKA